MNGSTLWYSVPSGAQHSWYINGSGRMTLTSSVLNVLGDIQENSINLSSKYVTNTSLNTLNYINSNTVSNLYISSNVFNSTLLNYTTNSYLNSQNYISSNSVENLCISSNVFNSIVLSNLTFTLPLSKTGNNVSIDLSSYDTIAYTIPHYLDIYHCRVEQQQGK